MLGIVRGYAKEKSVTMKNIVRFRRARIRSCSRLRLPESSAWSELSCLNWQSVAAVRSGPV